MAFGADPIRVFITQSTGRCAQEDIKKAPPQNCGTPSPSLELLPITWGSPQAPADPHNPPGFQRSPASAQGVPSPHSPSQKSDPFGNKSQASPVQLGSGPFNPRKADPGRQQVSCLRCVFYFFTASLPVF